MVMLILLIAACAAAEQQCVCDPAADQIRLFKQKTQTPIGVLKTSAGAPIDYIDATVTLNRSLILNEYFLKSLPHFLRERIPNRVVHANGAGAFGYFEVTHDITNICKAKLFSKIGKKTKIATRFSTAIGEKGNADTIRDARGFAVKFYTEEGNFDFLGLSLPVFVIKDPVLFTTFAHAQKKNPATNLKDDNTFWDFATLHPESLHLIIQSLADRGIPDGYRHMPGFSIHTYQFVNESGENNFVRFHFMPDAGVKNLFADEAKKITADDPDYSTRDLYRAIGNGEYPSWTLSIQVLTMNDVSTAGFDVFDVTKVLPLDRYPLTPVGRMVLNKNPLNFFAEMEQLAFDPANLVPGILGSPDKLFEARRLAYQDAQFYRLGANFNKITVNCPMHKSVLTYNRDGSAPLGDNDKDAPNYYPNSFNGPVPNKCGNKGCDELIEIHQEPPNNFEQAADFYMNELNKQEKARLVENILASLGSVAKFLQDRAVKLFKHIHPDLGNRIERGLPKNTKDCCGY